MLSLQLPGLRNRGAEKKASPPPPCRGRMSREAEGDVTGDFRFLPHLPKSSFFRAICPSDLPKALTSQTPLLPPQHLSLVWPLQSLTCPQLSLGRQPQILQLLVLGRDPHGSPAPDWPSPGCRQPGPAGITASLPPSFPPTSTIYGSPGPSHP